MVNHAQTATKPNIFSLTPIQAEKTVTLPSTAEALVAAPTRVVKYSIIAKPGNTGKVYIGDSTVDGAASATEGIVLSPGDEYEDSFPPSVTVDLADLFVDAEVASEGVDILYWTVD